MAVFYRNSVLGMTISISFLIADGFNFPLAVGNRWEYDNGFSITIVKQFTKGDTTFYGFTSYPWPDSLPQDIWDSAYTWQDFTNNFMAQVPSGFIMKDTLGGLAMMIFGLDMNNDGDIYDAGNLMKMKKYFSGLDGWFSFIIIVC